LVEQTDGLGTPGNFRYWTTRGIVARHVHVILGDDSVIEFEKERS
jgi:hypothetical protein